MTMAITAPTIAPKADPVATVAIIVTIFRQRTRLSIDDLSLMRW